MMPALTALAAGQLVMLQIGLVGLGAGAAAALLFASVTSGTWMSVPLFYIAPLPIMIAGLGWSHWSAMLAAIAASAAIGVAFAAPDTHFDIKFFMAFLAGVGLPAWWLGYLALLARPGDGASATAALEWYPPGRLVVWAAVLAALVVLVAIPNFGTDAESFRAGLTKSLSRLLRPQGLPADTSVPVPAGNTNDRLIGFLVTALPPAAAVIATITNIFNLWLAARIVKFSGRLTRPWPVLSEMTFPRMFSAALAFAIAVSFIDGLTGIVAGVVLSSLLMAYGVLGFAVLHSLTRNVKGRPFVLGSVYASVMIFGWPVLALCLLGVSETAFDLRARTARKGGPPPRL